MIHTIRVRVIPRAGKNAVKEFADGLKIYLTAPPSGGKANKALLKMLASHLGLKRSQLSILKGTKSREKIIGITY